MAIIDIDPLFDDDDDDQRNDQEAEHAASPSEAKKDSLVEVGIGFVLGFAKNLRSVG